MDQKYLFQLNERATLGMVDEVIVALGYSLVMDNFQRQQAFADFFICEFSPSSSSDSESYCTSANLLLPETLPKFVPEPIATPGKTVRQPAESANADLDRVLVNLSVVRQMFTVSLSTPSVPVDPIRVLWK